MTQEIRETAMSMREEGGYSPLAGKDEAQERGEQSPEFAVPPPPGDEGDIIEWL